MTNKLLLEEVLKTVQLPFGLAALQASDIQEAISCDRYGWFLEVGCGKTVCSTLVALSWKTPYVVIICPPIIIDDWADWLKSIGQTSVSVYRSPKRTINDLNSKWVVMSHSTYRNDFKKILLHYAARDVSLIVDEAHNMKSVESKLWKNTLTFIGKNRHIQMLTGTPTSKPTDTYAYMRIKTPDLYRSYSHWESTHVEEKDFFGAIKSYQNLELLRENFKLKTVTRDKREIFGYTLKPFIQPIRYNLSDKHMRTYRKLVEEQLLLLPSGKKIDATTAIRLRHALQQVVVNFSKFTENEEDVSASFELIEHYIDSIDPFNPKNSKFIIWTWYQSSSGNIYEYLKTKYGSATVTAAYGKVDSQKAVQRIKNDAATRLMVAHPGSVGVGLNLQYVCNKMLTIELPTTSIPVKQLIGRVDRVGQTLQPDIYFGVAKGTIQEYLFQKLLANDDLVSKVEITDMSLRQKIADEPAEINISDLRAQLLGNVTA